MSWVVIIVDPDDNKEGINWFLLKKIILGPVQGDQSLYIFPEFDYKCSSIVFFS